MGQDAWQSLVKETSTGFDVEGAQKVDAEAALELLEGGAIFVDVRRSIQFNLSHIAGAVNLDVNYYLTEENLLAHAEKDQKVVFYCSDVGCYRSANASAMALAWGFTDVVYYANGWSSWLSKDYPRE